MSKEKFITPLSGYLGVVVTLVTIVAGILLLVYSNEDVFMIISGIFLLIATVFMMIGLMVINPNESAVLVLFGDYSGTVVKNGFFWVNPFYVRKKISLRARNLNADPIKVNDKLGNPIMIGIVLVWRVRNTYKAAFEVDDYNHFVEIQIGRAHV